MAESKSLQDCLVYIQSNLKAPKSQYNAFGKYKYRKAEDILEALKPHLQATNCVVTISDEIVSVGDRIYVKATATLSNGGISSISTVAFAREADTKTGMDAAQVTGAASSYARKYALNGLFCIDDTEDSDATNGQDSLKGAIDYINTLTTEKQMAEAWAIYAPYFGGDKDFRAAFTKHQQAIVNGTR